MTEVEVMVEMKVGGVFRAAADNSRGRNKGGAVGDGDREDGHMGGSREGSSDKAIYQCL